MSLEESLNKPVSAYTTTSFAKVDATASIVQAAKVMEREGTTEAIVVRDSSPVGIITERDILFKVVASGEEPSKKKVGEVMSSPVETIDEGAKASEAIARMSKLGFRRLGVTRNGKIVGMITQKAVVAGKAGQKITLPELVPPTGFACPYCGTVLKTKEELSKHIDFVHTGGAGLLQGDMTKW